MSFWKLSKLHCNQFLPSYGERKTFHQDGARVLEEMPSFPRVCCVFFVAGIHGTAQLGCSRHQWLCLQGQTFWNEASWQLKRGRNGWKDMNNWTDHEKRWKRCLNLLEVKTGWDRSMPSMVPPGLGCPGPGWSLNHVQTCSFRATGSRRCVGKKKKGRKQKQCTERWQLMKMLIESALCFSVGSSLSIAWTCCRFVPIRSFVAIWSCDCKVPTMRWERCIGQKSVRTSTRRFEQIGVHIVLSFISWIKTTHSIWFGMILCMITTCPFLCRSWSLLIKFSRLELQPTSIHPKTGRRLPACDPIAPQSLHPKICLSYLSHTSPFVLGCIGFGAVHGQVPSSGKLPGPGSSRQQFWLENDELAELELNSTPGSMIPECFPQPGRQFDPLDHVKWELLDEVI